MSDVVRSCKPDIGSSVTRSSESEARRDELAAIRQALETTLGWRQDPALAFSASDEIAVGSGLSEVSSPPTADWYPRVSPVRDDPGCHSPVKQAAARTTTGGNRHVAASQVDFRASRPFDYGGLTVQVLAEPPSEEELGREIPVTVIDTVLRMIVEAHFAVWYVWHIPTAFCHAPGLEELLGIPREAVPTFTEEWFGLVHPEDLPRLVAENDQALRAISSFHSEYRLRCGNGDYVWVSDWAIVLGGSDGEAEWMAGGIRDITVEKALEESQHESAQLHEALFSKALMPAILIDSAGVIADANQAALDFFEIDCNGLVERPARDVLPPDLLDCIAREISAGRRHDEKRGTREIEFEVPAVKKWLLTTIVPFETRGGSMVFLLGVDLTEHRRVRDALARSEISLLNKTQALEERNVALKVLVDQRREDLDALRLSVTDNVEQLVMPTLDLLADALRGRPENALVEAARLTIDEITQPLLARWDSPPGGAPSLSRREYQVLQLIRAGKTTEAIARTLCLSPTTVTFHRGNIRRKMGLHGTGRRLASEVMVDALELVSARDAAQELRRERPERSRRNGTHIVRPCAVKADKPVESSLGRHHPCLLEVLPFTPSYAGIRLVGHEAVVEPAHNPVVGRCPDNLRGLIGLLRELPHHCRPLVDVLLGVRLGRLGRERLRDRLRVMTHPVDLKPVVANAPLQVLARQPRVFGQLLPAESHLVQPGPAVVAIGHRHPGNRHELLREVVVVDHGCLGDRVKTLGPRLMIQEKTLSTTIAFPTKSLTRPIRVGAVEIEVVPALLTCDKRCRQETRQLFGHADSGTAGAECAVGT